MNHTNTEITSSVKIPQNEFGKPEFSIPVFENCFQQTLTRPHSVIMNQNKNKYMCKPYGYLNPDNSGDRIYETAEQAYRNEYGRREKNQQENEETTMKMPISMEEKMREGMESKTFSKQQLQAIRERIKEKNREKMSPLRSNYSYNEYAAEPIQKSNLKDLADWVKSKKQKTVEGFRKSGKTIEKFSDDESCSPLEVVIIVLLIIILCFIGYKLWVRYEVNEKIKTGLDKPKQDTDV